MGKYYVYVLSDQGIPFYVGKGTGMRAYVHEMVVRDQTVQVNYEFNIGRDYNPYKTRKIKKILREGKHIEYSFPFYSDNESEALEQEILLIAKYGRKGIEPDGILTNRTLGGTGGDCISGLSDERYAEYRRKLSAANKGKKGPKSFLGKTHTPEVRERIRQAHLGNTKGAKPYSVKSPEGVVYTGTNVTKLSREIGLNEECMRAVVAGRQEVHRGWRRAITAS